MLTLFLITALLLGLAVAGLALRMLLVKGGKFPNTHIEHNPHMKAMGIGCARDEKSLCQGICAPQNKNHPTSCTGRQGLEEVCASCGFLVYPHDTPANS